MDQATYSRSRRAYPGGRPLPRILSERSRFQWAKYLRIVTEQIAAPSHKEQVTLLARSLGKVRAGAGRTRNLSGDQETPSENQIRKLLSGYVGVKPQRAYELGEASFVAGVPWTSGLVALSWAPEFQPHAIGLIGRCIVDGTRQDLDGLWDSFEFLTAPVIGEAPRVSRVRALDPWSVLLDDKILFNDEVLRRRFEWAERKHEFINNAWRKWSQQEGSSDLPDVIQAYLAVARMLPSSQLQDANEVLALALLAVNQRIYVLDPESRKETEEERLANEAFWAHKDHH